jgi:dienelactone hydrolase
VGFFFVRRFTQEKAAMRPRIKLSALLALVCALPLYAAELVTVKALLAAQGLEQASLSPDGRHIAAIGTSGLNHGLLLIDTETMKATMPITGKYAYDGDWRYQKRPREVTWITNDLIGVDYGYNAAAVDLKGKWIANLGEWIIGKADYAKPDSPMVLAITDSESDTLALIDARNGKKREFRLPSGGKLIARAFDSKGELRAVTMVNSAFWKDVSIVSNWYKSSAQGAWEKLAEFGVADEYWTPVSVPDEENALVISSRMGRDTYAVFAYDTKRRQIGEMMAGHPNQDIVRWTGDRDSAFHSVETHGMRPQTVWFDPAWAAIQKSVDTALPNRVNQLSGDKGNRVLVRSYADIDPGTWFLLDAKSGKMVEVGRAQYSIDPAQMRPMEITAYTAGDGLKIPAFLTRPADATGPAPTVIMIHGGPIERDEWHFNADVQFLASRGYVVFQPQFRGSAGFGLKFEAAGYGQWGQSMQDDITAGVEHLIKQGIADPSRICIYGSSYGGYAALWGLAKTPDLYKCGISFAGVSDIQSMFSDWSDSNLNKVTRQIMRSRIGDIRHNKAQFDAVSPLLHAREIKAPVLLMHGANDVRVPISHGKKMKRALSQNDKSVEWVEFENAGHGLQYVRESTLYYERLGAFLEKHIGAKAAAK